MLKLSRLLLLCLPVLLAACHNNPKTLFEKVTASHSGIDFNNAIIENDYTTHDLGKLFDSIYIGIFEEIISEAFHF